MIADNKYRRWLDDDDDEGRLFLSPVKGIRVDSPITCAQSLMAIGP